MKLNLFSGGYPLENFENLDRLSGWNAEDGLPYPDGSVEGISIGHGLMFVAIADWPALFSEVARVLEPGGVVRITEDATDDPLSERYGGHPDAVTLTGQRLVARHLVAAGLSSADQSATSTLFRDGSLRQNLHGGEPKAFFIEGVKPSGTTPTKQPVEPVTLTVVIPTIGRNSLGRAIRSAFDADEIIVVPNQHGDRGYRARNEGMARASGTGIVFGDDDDVFAPGAIGLFKEALRHNPDRPTIFKMRYHHGAELWKTEWLAFGNVGTPMFVVPNIPEKLGEWRPHSGSDTGGDFMFLQGCCQKMGDPVWRPEVVALIRPT